LVKRRLLLFDQNAPKAREYVRLSISSNKLNSVYLCVVRRDEFVVYFCKFIDRIGSLNKSTSPLLPAAIFIAEVAKKSKKNRKSRFGIILDISTAIRQRKTTVRKLDVFSSLLLCSSAFCSVLLIAEQAFEAKQP